VQSDKRLGIGAYRACIVQPLPNGGFMQVNTKQALENTQTLFFDICDLLEGNSYQSLGYDDRKEFLAIAKDKLSEIERFIDQGLTS
jgi:hypothetical protein